MNVIKLIDVVKTRTNKLECNINWLGQARTLWLSYPAEMDDFVDSNNVDWVLTSLLIPAMFANADLHLSGSVSSSLFYFSNSDIQKILCIQNPNLKKITIHADKRVKRIVSNTFTSAMGFSAGVDSFSSLAMLEEDQNTRPDYLVTLNVGAMGVGDKGRNMLKKYSSRLTEYCTNHNYKPIILDSNIDDFFEGLSYQATHSIRSAAAILALGGAISRYYYSSTFEYPSIGVHETYDMSYADPILLPLFSSEVTEFRAIGTNFSRLEKVQLICDFKPSFSNLDVCVGDPAKRLSASIPNCSECWKCARQLMTLELLDKLENYSKVFDLEKYKKNKLDIVRTHIMNVLAPNRPNDWDVIKLAIAKGKMKKRSLTPYINLSQMSWKIKLLLANKLTKEYVKGTEVV